MILAACSTAVRAKCWHSRIGPPSGTPDRSCSFSGSAEILDYIKATVSPGFASQMKMLDLRDYALITA